MVIMLDHKSTAISLTRDPLAYFHSFQSLLIFLILICLFTIHLFKAILHILDISLFIQVYSSSIRGMIAVIMSCSGTSGFFKVTLRTTKIPDKLSKQQSLY